MKSNLLRLVCGCLTLLAAAALAHAQQGTGTPAPPPTSNEQTAASAPSGSRADETFDLNIAERHIVKQNFQASTAIEAGDENTTGLNLRIGVSVGADEIDVFLRGVRGHVRFRGTLERILERLNAHSSSSSTGSSP